MKQPKLKYKGCLITGIVVFVGCFLTSYFVIDFPFAAAGLNRELARAQANNIPMVREDLNPNPPVLPEQNAGPTLVKWGSKIFDAVQKYDAASKAQNQQSNEYYDASRMKVIVPHLPAFLAANRKPQYWVDRDYDQSIDLKFPEFKGFKLIGKALAARARLRASQGDLKGAIDDLNAGFQLSHHLNDEPTLIGQLVSISIYNIEMVTVERLASGLVNDQATLQQLRQEVVEKSIPPSNFEKALRGECYMIVATLRNLERHKTSSSESEELIDTSIPIQRSGKPMGVMAKAYLARGLRYWNDLMESDAWKAGDPNGLGQEMMRLDKKYCQGGILPVSRMLDAITMPTYGAAGLAFVYGEANKRAMRSLLLVLEYHARKGVFPPTLKDAGAEALDPFLKDTPLHYSAGNQTVKVWSVGVNGKDEGGDSKNNHDVVAMYPPRKRS